MSLQTLESRSSVASIRAVNRAIVQAMVRDLDRFWGTLDLTRPELARNALLEFVPQLMASYGEGAAAVAADWYDEMRAAAKISGARSFRALPGAPVDHERVASRTRYAAGHLFTDHPELMLSFLKVAGSAYVLQPGRSTITESVRRDPARPRFARVPSGPKTCAFCLMLASRGPVYATDRDQMINKYHGDCDCTAVPIFTADDLPTGYNPDALRDQYQAARDQAGGSTKAILSELRKQQGIA